MKQNILHWQVVSFFLALCIYALFGSPTPDGFGFVEILTAILLSVSIRIENIRHHLLSVIVLVFGLSAPSLVGCIRGNDFSDQIRDIIPFLFLFLPLFYGWIVKEYQSEFLKGLVGIGFIFSMRTIWAYRDVVMTPVLWGQGAPADLLYLANSPEVLCAAIYCLGMGGDFVIQKKEFMKGAVMMAMSLIPVVGMALMMQRAGLGAFIAAGLIGFAIVFYMRPITASVFGVVMVAVVSLIFSVMSPVFMTLLQKTELVGLNSRAEEWAAVFDVLTKDWTIALFGEGWGGRIDNPAVGGLNVNYTHSLLSSVLLKTGFIGAGIILSGILMPVAAAIYDMARDRKANMMIGIALVFPFLIATTLYASYKSLGFGLILLAFSSFPRKKLEKTPLSVS